MIVAIFSGIATGLIMSLSTGPVFFTLLQTSIQDGFHKTIFFIAGISFIDATMISICWFGLKQIGIAEENATMSIIGAIILMSFGVSFFFKKGSRVQKTRSKRDLTGNSKLFLKAIVIGGSNPIVWAFWAAIVEYGISTFDTDSGQLMYFLGILLTILFADCFKAYFAERLGSLLSERYFSYLNYAIGVLLIGFGVNLLISSFS